MLPCESGSDGDGEGGSKRCTSGQLSLDELVESEYGGECASIVARAVDGAGGTGWKKSYSVVVGPGLWLRRSARRSRGSATKGDAQLGRPWRRLGCDSLGPGLLLRLALDLEPRRVNRLARGRRHRPGRVCKDQWISRAPRAST